MLLLCLVWQQAEARAIVSVVTSACRSVLLGSREKLWFDGNMRGSGLPGGAQSNNAELQSMERYSNHRCHGAGGHRGAYSLLEVVLASTICAGALVPALAVMRDGIALGDAIDTRHLLLTYGVSKMEEQLAVVGATWATGTITGSFASDGQAGIRFSATRSDSAGSGGIPNRLMTVTITTYSDDNGNNVMDASEARLTLMTKIAKLVSYETKASS